MENRSERLDRLEAQKRELDARIARERRRLGAQERKARNHALMVMGGLLESHVGSWRAVDFDALAMWLKANDEALKALTTDELPAGEAARRLRDWERRGRTAEG